MNNSVKFIGSLVLKVKAPYKTFSCPIKMTNWTIIWSPSAVRYQVDNDT